MTSLIVNDAHRRVLHNGVRDTLTEVRTRYWVVKGRSLVRRIIHRCITYRWYERKPYLTPPPPPLPVTRVKDEPPFTFTGVDFAGPILIRTRTDDQPRRHGSACSHVSQHEPYTSISYLTCRPNRSSVARKGLLLVEAYLRDLFPTMEKVFLRRPHDFSVRFSRTTACGTIWPTRVATGHLTSRRPQGGVVRLNAWFSPQSGA